MKFYFKFGRKLVGALSIFGLLFSPSANTQTQSGGVNAALAVLNQVDQTIRQGLSGRVASQRALSMRRQLQNQLGQPAITRAKFFEHCRLPAAISKFPENACEQINLGDPTEVQAAEQIKLVSQQYRNMYESAKSLAQNTRRPQGLQCLTDAKKTLDQQFGNSIQELTAAENAIRKQAEIDAAVQKKLANEIKQELAFLKGGENAADITDLFKGTSCMKVVDNALFEGGGDSKGIEGVYKALTSSSGGQESLQTLARNVDGEIGKLAKDISSQKKKMRQDIARLGINGWINQGEGRFNRLGKNGKKISPHLREAVDQESKEFSSQNQIELQYLRNLGIRVNLNNKDYIRDITRHNRASFQKEIINDCVLKTNKTKLGFDANGAGKPVAAILSQLNQHKTSINLTVNDYIGQVRSVLTNGDPIEDNLAKIEALNDKSITFAYKDPETGVERDLNLHQYLGRVIFKCHQITKFGESFIDKTTGKTSQTIYNQRAKDAERALKKFKSLEKGFIGRIERSIDDQLVTCKEKTLSANDCSDPKQMTPDSDQFCAKTAKTCRDQVKSCALKAKALGTQRVQKVRTKIKKYNDKMQELYNKQNASLQAVRNKFLIQKGNFLKKYFPGADYQLPKKLFVKLPRLVNEPGLLGTSFNSKDNKIVQFLGGFPKADGTSAPFYQSFPAQISKLRASFNKMINEGPKSVDAQVKEYIASQKEAIETNQKKWQALEGKCTAALNNYDKALAEENKKRIQDYNKLDSSLTQFCYKYAGLARSNPAAGCGEGSGGSSPEGLYKEAAKISTYLDRSVGFLLNQYTNLCARSQHNNKSEGDENPLKIQEICDNGSFEDRIEKYKDELIAKLPSGLRDDAEEFFESGEKSEDLEKSPYSRFLSAANRLIKVKDNSNGREDIRAGLKNLQNNDRNYQKALALAQKFKDDDKDIAKAITTAEAKSSTSDKESSLRDELETIKARYEESGLDKGNAVRSIASDSDFTSLNSYIKKWLKPLEADATDLQKNKQKEMYTFLFENRDDLPGLNGLLSEKPGDSKIDYDNIKKTLEKNDVLINAIRSNNTFEVKAKEFSAKIEKDYKRYKGITAALGAIPSSTDSDNEKAVENLKNIKAFGNNRSKICKYIEDEKRWEAIKSCNGSNENYSSTCISKALKDKKDDLTTTESEIESDLRKMTSLDKLDITGKWAELGLSMGACKAQMDQGRNPSQLFFNDPNFQNGVNSEGRTLGQDLDFFTPD